MIPPQSIALVVAHWLERLRLEQFSTEADARAPAWIEPAPSGNRVPEADDNGFVLLLCGCVCFVCCSHRDLRGTYRPRTPAITKTTQHSVYDDDDEWRRV
ncbi:glutathione S-transferase-like protein [Anopheles sinensis]|uniref:Glutathione S-transferase-like protein n=1 Tax=Anopheles sinensis TaxID=74873 RepID=A0A084VN44_ANOSI|nr:glutathione S-transferase-like protein [Anopheles sinensis]